MAKGALFIGWGAPIAGREQKALGFFDETVAYYGKLQQQGDIESFEPIILEPHGGDLDGFFLLRGDSDKLARVRSSAEFIDSITHAQMLLTHIGVVTAWYGDELQQVFGNYGKHIANLT